ncbi:MAG: ECF-type sigma factor [Gemmataceae bacterium]|nr:ECF-type sigma factor [Gemmataceae bacterium]
MSGTGSVSHWIAQLKAGEHAAAQPLWEAYYRQLVERARHKLHGTPRRAADEEDVVLSAFDSFCRAAAQGRFPRLEDRHDLWQVLVLITDRKACDLANHERRQRRGGGKVLDEAALAAADASDGDSPLARLLGAEPSPDFAAQVAEQCQRLLHALGDGELRQVALRKLEGYTIAEIAAQLGLVPRTVQRRLQLIRRLWERELQA